MVRTVLCAVVGSWDDRSAQGTVRTTLEAGRALGRCDPTRTRWQPFEALESDPWVWFFRALPHAQSACITGLLAALRGEGFEQLFL